jgi:hypothetical protein
MTILYLLTILMPFIVAHHNVPRFTTVTTMVAFRNYNGKLSHFDIIIVSLSARTLIKTL